MESHVLDLPVDALDGEIVEADLLEDGLDIVDDHGFGVVQDSAVGTHGDACHGG